MVTYSLLIIGLLSLTGISVIGLSGRVMTQGLADRQRGLALCAAAEFSASLDRAADDLLTVADTLPSCNPEMILAAFVQRHPACEEIVWLDAGGNELAYATQPGGPRLPWNRLAQSPAVAQAQALAQTRGVVDTSSGMAILDLAVLVGSVQADSPGVLAARLNVEYLCSSIFHLDLGPRGGAYVVDERGLIIGSSEQALVGQPWEGNHTLVPGFSAAQEQSLYYDRAGELVVGTKVSVARASMGHAEWTLVIVQPVRDAYDSLKYVTVFVVEILLASLYLVLAVSWWLGRRLARPIRVLQEGTAIVGSGNLDHTIELRTGDELEDLAEAFNTMVANLAAMDRDRERFVDVLSHELKTPLVGLRAILSLLHGGAVDPAVQSSYQEVALWDVDRMLRLVDDLLELNRDQALCCSSVDLAGLVRNALGGLQAAAGEKDIALQIRLPPDLPPLTANPDRLARVLLNLVQNAIQYTPAGGQITVAATNHETEVWVSVQDTGIGIQAEEQERIFETFRRGAMQPPSSSGGAGLGLAISRQIVELHGGRIWVESAPGRGSTFTFSIPMHPPT